MRVLTGRRATLVWVTAAVVSFAGAAATAQPALAKGGNSGSHGKGGNNGTIKIHDGSEKNPQSNNPHLVCPLIVSYSGFDNTAANPDATHVTINTIPPSTPHASPLGLVDDSSYSFVQSGSKSYTIYTTDLAGATANNKGEYHVYVHVTVTTSKGADVKNKAVWLTPCVPQTPEVGASNLTLSTTCDKTTLDYVVDAESTKTDPPATGDYTFTPDSGTVQTGTFPVGSAETLAFHSSGTLEAVYDGITKSVTGDTADCASTPTPSPSTSSPSVLPTQATVSPSPSVSVLGEHITKAAKLPFTGPPALIPMALAAAGLLFLGLALISGGRRYRPTHG